MRIRKIFVTNYKNLVDCEIRPQLIHAITGCNGSGKSNLLEVFTFVSKLISGADADREKLFNEQSARRWIPVRANTAAGLAFRFEIECEIKASDSIWVVEYKLAFSPFATVTVHPTASMSITTMQTVKIASEILTAKEISKPGTPRTLIERSADGSTVVSYTSETKAKLRFPIQDNLSVLKVLEIREPKSFNEDFPVIVAFRDSLLSTDLIRLNATKLIDFTGPESGVPFSRRPGMVVEHFAPYKLLKSIEGDKEKWKDFCDWMRTLCNVERINLIEVNPNNIERSQDPSKASNPWTFIILEQYGRSISPSELSTGHAMVFGILTALFTFLRHNGPVFLEEPESYLHPKAVIDLLEVLRELSDDTTVLISTHSPVLLNELRPEEVTVMERPEVGYFTTKDVKDIAEAVAVLKRGYITMGELLQSNFVGDED